MGGDPPIFTAIHLRTFGHHKNRKPESVVFPGNVRASVHSANQDNLVVLLRNDRHGPAIENLKARIDADDAGDAGADVEIDVVINYL